jgi:flagellar hook assembly protein FlgD
MNRFATYRKNHINFPIRQINISGKKTQIWDGTNSNGNRVKDGFYLYNISCENYFSKFNKLLIID